MDHIKIGPENPHKKYKNEPKNRLGLFRQKSKDLLGFDEEFCYLSKIKI